MSDTPTPPRQPNPWRQALREARAIIIASFLIAITYNIFAVTSVPWLREVKQHDTTSAAVTADTTSGTAPGNTVTSTPDIDTTIATVPIDTAITTPADSAKMAAMSKAQRDSIMKAARDSSRLAKEEQARTRDSVQRAELGTIVAGNGDIKTDVAKRIFDAKMAVFIDARPEDQYNEGHILNAINIYAEQWQASIPEIIKIPKDKPIVTYCGGGDECELSHDLAKSLRAMGYKSVVVYTGGITDWTAKKYPTAK